MKSRNENLTAFSFSIPLKIPVEIVIPLLETPGNKASIWNKPIIREFFMFNLDFLRGNFENIKIVPVNKNPIPVINKDENVVSIIFLRKKPNKAPGIVAIIKYSQSLRASLVNVKRNKISFLVKIKTASKEAIWRKIMKNKFGSENKFEYSARCPSLEIGRNSVIAWITAIIISFNIMQLWQQALKMHFFYDI